MMISCREAARLASEGMDRALSLSERLALRAHLLMCKGCTNFAKQMAFLRKAMARLVER